MKRRDILAGVVAVGAAVAAGVYRFTDLIVKHYAPTPYDDLLSKLTDREQAAKLGAQVSGVDTASDAARLRAVLQNKSLADAAAADITAGHMVEVQGWVLPETVVLLSALAARVQTARA
jgi:hypothetical protein